MNGKQHLAIGTFCGLIAGYGVSKITNDFSSVSSTASTVLAYKPIIACAIGAGIGALIVDVDSKKSKATQQVAKIAMYCIWALALVFIFRQEWLKDIIGYSYGIAKTNITLTLFVLLVTLGKMSPHRQFTHKIIGTLCFCIVGYLLLPQYANFGFIIGYISHLVADMTTDNGLNVFDLKLPMMDSKNKFKYHF